MERPLLGTRLGQTSTWRAQRPAPAHPLRPHAAAAPPPRRRACRHACRAAPEGAAALDDAPAPAQAAPAPAELLTAEQAFDFGVSSRQGPRPSMEDAVRVEHGLPGGLTFAAVLDGHGGPLSAEWLARELFPAVAAGVGAGDILAPDSDEDEARPGSGGDDAGGWRAPPGALERELADGVRWPRAAGAALARVFREVDGHLIGHLRTEFGIEQMGASGATALVALIHPGRAVFASLGDCLAVVCRGGRAARATQQHRVYGWGPGVLEELERVEATGAWVVDGRVCSVLAVSRAFGDPEFKGDGLRTLLQEGARKGMWPRAFAESHTFSSDPVIVEPDVTELRFTPEDEFLILATDGLWDAVPEKEAAEAARRVLSSGKGAQAAADALTALAEKRYTTDNVTVVVVDLRARGRAAPGAGGGGGWLGGFFGGGGGGGGGGR